MLIEETELTMSHVALGSLTEYGLLILFGNAHSRCLVDGTGLRPDQLRDSSGELLYPAYFKTHLEIPIPSLLPSYRLWQSVDVGVVVERFGGTLLESNYVLGRGGEIANDPSSWRTEDRPSMKGNSLMVVATSDDNRGNRRVAAPASDSIAPFPMMRRPPQAIKEAKQVRAGGFQTDSQIDDFEGLAPVEYEVVMHRDAAPGREMVFAKFPEIMDFAESRVLTRQLRPGLPLEAVGHLALLERQTHYYANCFAGELLDIHYRGHIEGCQPDFIGDDSQIISIGQLSSETTLYRRRDNRLLAMARTRKLITIPARQQDLMMDTRHVIELHARRRNENP